MAVKCYYKDQTIFEGEWEDAPHHKDSSKVLHRKDGSAIEWIDGEKYWYLSGRLHREDGPAIERSHGAKEWWLDYERYRQKEFNKILKEVDSLEPTIGLLDPREWVRERFKRRFKNEL